MKRRKQRGLFDLDDRIRDIALRDPLARLSEVVDWEAFRVPIEQSVQKDPKSPGGRPRFDAVVMFKTLVIQRLYHLSDAQTEFMIRDRLSFMRFVGVDLHEVIPDEKTIWRFREELIRAGVMDELWETFHAELGRLGVKTSRGKIVDASIVETIGAPRKKDHAKDRERDSTMESVMNSTEDTKKPTPTEAHERQMDTDARWTVKRRRAYFGYKNHIKIDAGTKLITMDVVTDASVHDRVMLPVLLSEDDAGCEFYADKGYAGVGPGIDVHRAGAEARILNKAWRNKPLTEDQRQQNRLWSKVRSRFEHVFADQRTGMKFTGVRSRGFPRAEFTIRMNNLVYNMRRLTFLVREPAEVPA
jgi:transposase, IS5 family